MTRFVNNPFRPFARWLEWLVSHDGRIHRRLKGDSETDSDVACLLPTPPSQSIVTIGDLRNLVQAGEEWKEMTDKELNAEKLLDKIMSCTGNDLKDRLREKCLRLVRLIDESAPSIILSLEVAQLFWNATALLGTQVWEEVGKSIVPYARNRMGKCQECEEDIAVVDTHPHSCPGCEERVKQEAEAMSGEINKNI